MCRPNRKSQKDGASATEIFAPGESPVSPVWRAVTAHALSGSAVLQRKLQEKMAKPPGTGGGMRRVKDLKFKNSGKGARKRSEAKKKLLHGYERGRILKGGRSTACGRPLRQDAQTAAEGGQMAWC